VTVGLLKNPNADELRLLRSARNDVETHILSLRGAQRRSNLDFFNSPTFTYLFDKMLSYLILIVMPRVARIVIPNVPHHITQRGNNKQDVFFVDDDKKAFLRLN
jgi:hypothetical protein